MPTGYTSAIEDGIDFKNFTLQCARAFGACLSQRDDKQGPELKMDEPSDYYEEALKEAKEEYNRVIKMNKTEIENFYQSRLDSAMANLRIDTSEKTDLLNKYKAMLNQVKNWTPPTKDHENLKKFMIEQIESSIKFDCSPNMSSYYQQEVTEILSKTPNQLHADRIKSLAKNIEYNEKHHNEEVERCRKNNEWKKSLIESLG